MKASYQFWRDRRGRLSPLRIAALVLLLVPIALAAEAWLSHRLAARLFNDLVHRTGYWALIYLMIALAITPLQRTGRFRGLLDVRRMIGVGAFVYATAHILLYVADERFDLIKVASEIIKRLYLTIGLIAWLGLLALAVTSTDGMVRRVGALRWRRLHQVSYVIGMLALVHFFQQTKADFTLPATVTGLFVWLMACRLVAARMQRNELSALALLILTVVVAALVILGEAIGIALWYRAPPILVLQAAFDFELAIRPGWYVLAAGLGVVVIARVGSSGRYARQSIGRSATAATTAPSPEPLPALDRIRRFPTGDIAQGAQASSSRRPRGHSGQAPRRRSPSTLADAGSSCR
jgi:sulfoxide reductase heme-binding subunit YedZ